MSQLGNAASEPCARARRPSPSASERSGRTLTKSPLVARIRSPRAAGSVIALRCRSATSRTSTTPNLRSGQPGTEPSAAASPARSRSTNPVQRGSKNDDRIDHGEFKAAPSRATKSHAARSAIVFDFPYGCTLGSSNSSSPSSVNKVVRSFGAVSNRHEGRGQHHALDAGVARGLQHAQCPFRAGSDHLIRVLRHGDRKGDATCSTVVAPRTASAQPASVLRSARKRSAARRPRRRRPDAAWRAPRPHVRDPDGLWSASHARRQQFDQTMAPTNPRTPVTKTRAIDCSPTAQKRLHL